MRSNIPSFKLIILVCVLALANCTQVSNSNPPQETLQETQAIANPYTLPADAYLALGKNHAGDEQQSYYLMAAGRLIHDGQLKQANAILARMHDTTPSSQRERNILLAKIDLAKDEPRSAIRRLAAVSTVNSLPVYYQAQFHDVLAQAYQSSGNAVESVAERIKLGQLLPDVKSQANNLRALWLTLTTLPVAELNTLAIETADGSELKGWMQLALISRKNYRDPQIMAADIRHWQVQYPEHPANRIFPLHRSEERLLASPRQVALLLPTTGPLAGPGNAIRDGFMAAHAAGKEQNTKIKVYNTHSANITMLYEQAVDEGADYIVGPLTKADVAIVGGLEHPVPTLLLNDYNGSAKNNVYQFGLSPSNEAKQVAVKARKQGHSRALIIAPAGTWGDEVSLAFMNQWRASGGRVVDAWHYQPKEDLDNSVREFLRITQGEARKKNLQRLFGRNLEGVPMRRQDFDMIFLLAYPSKARQIMPLLKYYYAGDVPVYSTSSVYAGSINALKDRDLNGIIFCDMPWVFTHHSGNKNWPEQFNSYNRLYALGMDSYALATQLNQLLLFPALGVNEKSGILYLSPNQQIARVLTWGQFKQGMAKPLGDKVVA
ncbi:MULTISPECIES: penicillin-binding protein activator [Legionella]|uniref:penicillin-binding protein activator n=1 Tax=Legionella TaxID=445 RepID=UPI000F8F727C|nr:MULTISPECIES: penicillin-binding protein activator [Legionella]MCP0914843.1 penicillin-binding protein activator [Legionella sp. 27cVA30]RUR11507.1 penicillin-binding protein activator [Legionella septentrionalis]RUR16772.1 penicillin-binding protein activator [Legionella septentrionalis]